MICHQRFSYIYTVNLCYYQYFTHSNPLILNLDYRYIKHAVWFILWYYPIFIQRSRAICCTTRSSCKPSSRYPASRLRSVPKPNSSGYAWNIHGEAYIVSAWYCCVGREFVVPVACRQYHPASTAVQASPHESYDESNWQSVYHRSDFRKVDQHR